MVICATDEQKKIISQYNQNVFPILDFNDKYLKLTKNNYNIKKSKNCLGGFARKYSTDKRD